MSSLVGDHLTLQNHLSLDIGIFVEAESPNIQDSMYLSHFPLFHPSTSGSPSISPGSCERVNHSTCSVPTNFLLVLRNLPPLALLLPFPCSSKSLISLSSPLRHRPRLQTEGQTEWSKFPPWDYRMPHKGVLSIWAARIIWVHIINLWMVTFCNRQRN